MTQYNYDTIIEEINNLPSSDRTVAKEKWGEKAIKENHLWNLPFSKI